MTWKAHVTLQILREADASLVESDGVLETGRHPAIRHPAGLRHFLGHEWPPSTVPPGDFVEPFA